MVLNFGRGFFGVLLEALGIFLGFDFWPQSIIPVTWNPEYPPGIFETAYFTPVVVWTRP